MFSRCVTLLLLLFGGWNTCLADEFDAMDGGFRIHFPGSKSPKSQDVELKAGLAKIKGVVFSAGGEQGETAYLVIFADYPAELLAEKGPENVVKDAVAHALSRLGADTMNRIAETNPRPLDQRFAFQGKLGEEKFKGQLRVMLEGHRIYEILVWGASEKYDDKAAMDFLQSFRISKSESE